MKDTELKSTADDWAEKIYHQICLACEDPTIGLEAETARIYGELKEWGWFDLCPIGDDNAENVTRMHLALRKYAKLIWEKEHPPKQKLSKWEIVTGKTLKKK
tara:strand:+ start:73 stop:378 length:306 start_codon:yes stop_codon:yes gene_type:complete